MDTTALRLTDLTPENTEVVGLNGKPAGPCGYGLPIIRHRPTGLFGVLSLARKPGPAWGHEPELREMEAAGRLTLFPEAIKLPSGWSAEKGQQPVVAWFSRFLASWPLHQPQQPTFLLLAESGPFLFCADQGDVEKWLSDLAALAQAEFDRSLAGGPPRWEWLAEVAEVGLQAAREHGQRYWMYVRRGVALYFRPAAPPELAYQLFRGAVEPAYRGVTWARFLEGMGVVYERAKYLRQEAAAEPARARKDIIFPGPEDLFDEDLFRELFLGHLARGIPEEMWKLWTEWVRRTAPR